MHCRIGIVLRIMIQSLTLKFHKHWQDLDSAALVIAVAQFSQARVPEHPTKKVEKKKGNLVMPATRGWGECHDSYVPCHCE